MGCRQAVVTLLGLFSSGALAGSCSIPEGSHYEITSPADIPRLFSDCTDISGDILITNSYSGAFVLPGVDNIFGKLYFEWDGWYQWDPDYSRAPNVTSIEIPDVRVISEVIIQDIPTLRLVAMPKLEEIWNGFSLLQGRNPPVVADFRALRHAGDFDFDGLFTSINLDSLEDVTQRLEIGAAPGAPISLPRFISARGLFFWGSPSSVSLPALRRVGESPKDSYGLAMSFKGESAISLDFPELRIIHPTFEVGGNITSLSLPLIPSIAESFTVTSTSRLNFSVPLEKVDSIHLGGRVETASFPALRYVKTVDVDADYAFDCEGFLERIQRVWSRMDVSSKWFRFECKVPPPPRSWTRLGSLLAVAFVVGILLFVLGRTWRRWRRRRLLQMDLDLDELPAYGYPESDPPPKYSRYDGEE
ncbi:hypothetical protein BJY00DRAFT_216794 [Aspergillus carlsbadensis]|nr:hypothetical protein BJY00DRAFT_216794 [Aspergillus carlsbadensis]